MIIEPTALPTSDRAISPLVVAQFLGVTLIWGSTWIIIHSQLAAVPAAWSVTYRFLIAGVVLLLASLVSTTSRYQLRTMKRADHGFVLLVALLQFSFNFNLVYRAQQHLTSGLMALLFALLIIPNAAFGAIFLGQRVTRRFVLGSAIAIGGLVLVFGPDLVGGTGDRAVLLTGLGLGLGSILCASIANVLQATQRGRALPLAPMLALAMIYGSVFNGLYAWMTAGPPQIEPSAGYIGGLFYLAIVASVMAFSLYYRLLRSIGPAAAAYTSVLVPILAMGLSTLFEGYIWTASAAAGVALVLAGMVIALRGRA